MSRLTAELTLDQIDEWFSIGKSKAIKLASIPAGTLQGRLLDPQTGKAYVPEKPNFDRYYPAYKRDGTHQPFPDDYIQQLRRQEETLERLPGMSQPSSSGKLNNSMEQLDIDSTFDGSIQVSGNTVPHNATHVYDSYNFQHQYDPKLPITHHREEVVANIESNQVTIIQGSTGSGKTTQVPQFILDHYAQEQRYCNIVVTQPRRIAAVSIARRVCKERNWALGTVCGYQIGMERQASEDTRLLYCTTGVLREKFLGKKNMHEYTHVILDEVHERDQDSDFLLLIVKKLLRTNSRHVKVVLMSATMNSDEFASYFSLPVRDVLEPAPVVNVEGHVFTVSQFFIDNLTKLGPLPHFEECYPQLYPEVVEIAKCLVQQLDKLEEKEQGIDPSTGFAPVRGSVLVFIPGYQEIATMFETLQTITDKHRLTVIPLHSTITLDEQSRVFLPPAKGYRKVILSTNIAESSITVPDIKYVIDFCLTKNMICDRNTNFTHLQVEWASHSNCTQRKGRAGRVSHGRVYFMVPRDFYDNCLPSLSIPEMQRCPLDLLVLKSKLLEMGEPIAVLSQALSPPDLNDIECTILSLKEVGALCIQSEGTINRYDGDLTFIGRVLADLPVDIRVGKLMILGYVFGLLEECIIIGAALSLKSLFSSPFQRKLDAFKHKLSWSDNSLSDCLAILNAYRVWEKKKQLREFQRTGQTEKDWGLSNFIQIRSIKEVSELVKELEQRLEKFNLLKVRPYSQHEAHAQESTDSQNLLLLKIVLCGAFYPNYFLKKTVEEDEAVKCLSNHDPLNTVMVRGLPQNQGLLYKDRLVQIFSDCGKNPSVTVEESRAYISFPWTNTSWKKQNGVHPAVYTAIKKRHLRIPMVLDSYDAVEVNKMMKTLVEAQEQAASQGLLRTNRMAAADSILPSENIAVIPHPIAVPEPSMSVLEILITEVVECGHFFAQCMETNSVQNLKMLLEMLNSPGRQLQNLQQRPFLGMLCAAPYLDEEELFYRARVEELVDDLVQTRNGSRRMTCAKVFFVDFGNTEKIPLDRLCRLPPEAMNIPAVAFECELIEIRPSIIRCTEGKWSHEANLAFRSMVINKKFLVQTLEQGLQGKIYFVQGLAWHDPDCMVYSVVANVVRLKMFERLPNGREIVVNEQLVNLQFADKAEEPYLSKKDHEWREMQLSEARKATSSVSSTMATQPMLRLEVKQPPSNACRKGRKFHLSGPMNPLEMEFYSMTQTGGFRSVRVDPESVNSAAVDNEPQNRHSRLMVAAFVGLNPDGDVLVARDTTIMPQIPGLPALVCLLFTPTAELRTDRKKQYYIGALCGLGFNPEDRNLPLLPDTDIEVTFDVRIDDDDIQLINHVRHVINMALGSRSKTAEWGSEAVASLIQLPAREKLLRLLQRRREPLEPHYFHKSHIWNQIHSDDMIYMEENPDSDFLTLLQLHSMIELQQPEAQIPADFWNHIQQHIRYLHRVAKREVVVRDSVKCELCNMVIDTPHLLEVHLQTQRHIKREERVKQAL